MTGVTLITGAASGIGRACALAFADEGVTRLILADLNLLGLEQTGDLLRKLSPDVEILVIKTDTSSEAEVQRMVDTGVEKFGNIQYAVNCAGVTSEPRAKSADLSVEAWDRVMNINIRGVWLCQRAVIRQMLKQEYLKPEQMRSGAAPERGSIVNISSVLGRSAHPTNGSVCACSLLYSHLLSLMLSFALSYAPTSTLIYPGARFQTLSLLCSMLLIFTEHKKYAAAKHAVLGQSRTDAASYGLEGIRVNSVCPGII